MLRRASILAFAAAFLASTGCSKEEDPTYEPEVFIGITASATAVLANGSNAVTLTVTDTLGGPVAVTTTRGAFSSGGQSATVAGAHGTLTLVTCDAGASSGCAGVAVVTASSATGTAWTTVTFGALAEVCATSCSADPGCAGQACIAAGGAAATCSATNPSACVAAAACTPSPASATTETSCSDGVDNDCDGATDCADGACDGQACGAGSVCQAGACTDIASGVAIKVTPARSRLPANGATTTNVVVEVTADGAAAAGLEVSLATDLGGLSQATATTGADGKAVFQFTSSATVGVATLVATLTAQPELTSSATVTMPALGSFQLAASPVQHLVMGATGSAWNELGWIQVQVLDDEGSPYPDGLAVRFEHQALGGSTLGAPLAPDSAACQAALGCVAHEGLVSSGSGAPDSTGLAKAWLHSGTVAGTLAVTAKTTAGGATLTASLPTVVVVGAKASGANFSLVCGPRNVPALAETDCAISLVDAPFTCVALLKDRFDNLLGTQTQVIFASEAGAVGAVATTPAYAPGSDPTSQAELGSAVQIVNTLGAGLPFDVPALGGEPSVVHGQDGCGSRSHNPRDGLVTLTAIADGEEAFFDANGNGVYDGGEPFVDQGEPFVDQDDSGAWESGEWFLDVNGNRAYDPPNGSWDAVTKIWTQTVVVYTGTPATLPAPGGWLGTRWVAGSAFTSSCTATPTPAPFDLDASSDGPPPVEAEPEAYVVVASDLNLNRLTGATSYEVAVTKGSITADYEGLPAYADGLGLFYRYWPCDRNGVCASQCRAPAADLPCVMTPSISGFTCGIGATVILTGGDADATESCGVEWTVQTPYQVYGTGKNEIVERALSGTTSPP